jgi:hypothetical protein
MPEYVVGDVQEAKAAPSRLHSKLDPDCVAVIAKLGLDEFESAGGCEVIDVFGGTVSIVQLWPVVVPAFPARSAVALTSKLCGPSASGPYACGLVHPAKAAASTLHWNPVTDSFALKEKLPLAAFEFVDGAESIVVVGAALSMTKLREEVQAELSPGVSFACASQ